MEKEKDINKEKNTDIQEEISDKEIKSEAQENETKSENTNSAENDTEEKSDKKEELSIEDKYNALNDKYLRLTAEFDNYRKRTLKEKMELIKSAGEDILINFLPVIDNLERAQRSVDEAKDISAVKEGIELIFKNLSEFLKTRGIKEIEAIGEDFDTDLHEALTKIPAPDKKMKGKVIDVIEKGYKLNEKVIRFAKVVVGE